MSQRRQPQKLRRQQPDPDPARPLLRPARAPAPGHCHSIIQSACTRASSKVPARRCALSISGSTTAGSMTTSPRQPPSPTLCTATQSLSLLTSNVVANPSTAPLCSFDIRSWRVTGPPMRLWFRVQTNCELEAAALPAEQRAEGPGAARHERKKNQVNAILLRLEHVGNNGDAW